MCCVAEVIKYHCRITCCHCAYSTANRSRPRDSPGDHDGYQERLEYQERARGEAPDQALVVLECRPDRWQGDGEKRVTFTGVIKGWIFL